MQNLWFWLRIKSYVWKKTSSALDEAFKEENLLRDHKKYHYTVPGLRFTVHVQFNSKIQGGSAPKRWLPTAVKIRKEEEECKNTLLIHTD